MIYHVGTQEYERKLADLRLKPDEARWILFKQITKEEPLIGKLRAVYGSHQLIVGDSYHFFMKQKTGGIPLTGYYVDGNTGKIDYRQIDGSVPYRHQE